MNTIQERIEKLRGLMRERRIDAYLIPTSDYHDSEYTGPHFACRRFMTGFTGSAGTALVTGNWAGLWTDGRYYVQAAAELRGSGVTLMKSGQPGVPTVEDFIADDLPHYGTLGFDGRVVSTRQAERLARKLEAKKISFACTEALVGMLWENRPALSAEPVWILEEKYAGQSAAEKLERLRGEMAKHHADVHILTTLDDIAWLLNLRGNDIPCTPVFLSYLLVEQYSAELFVNPQILSGKVLEYLRGLGVSVRGYQEIYSRVRELSGVTVLLCKDKVNYALVHGIGGDCRILDAPNPSSEAKIIKNPTEVKNIRQAHIRDGVAMTKFLYWLKTRVGKERITECSAAAKLDGLRREAGATDISFPTISAYGANAAMCHYHASPEHDAELAPKGFYLVDSGGHYLEGSTDITRTVVLGPVSAEEKEHYTLVLMGMLRLGNARFPRGCTGRNLDILAREPLWQRGLDYNHGTGHGVGYLLNVHEGPVAIRARYAPGAESAVFAPGMVCSDEPGLYLEGRHGIRIENLMVCEEAEKTECGDFLRFSFLTWVPIDLAAVELSLMEERDIRALNEYHAQVCEKIAPHLTSEEAEWLREVTRPVGEVKHG